MPLRTTPVNTPEGRGGDWHPQLHYGPHSAAEVK